MLTGKPGKKSFGFEIANVILCETIIGGRWSPYYFKCF
jgi:hypothetical protein